MTATATDADDTTTDEPTLTDHWIPVLAEFWRQADWDQMGGTKQSRADFFGTRVRLAKRQGDVHAALDKLARKLGMAVPELPTKHLTPLVENNAEAMAVLKDEHVWLVNLTDQAVSNFFASLEDPAAENDPTTTDLSDFIDGDGQ